MTQTQMLVGAVIALFGSVSTMAVYISIREKRHSKIVTDLYSKLNDQFRQAAEDKHVMFEKYETLIRLGIESSIKMTTAVDNNTKTLDRIKTTG